MDGAFNPFDLFVLVVLVLATFWGGVRGIVSQLTSLLSWLASAYIATHYYYVVAKFMNSSYSLQTPMAMVVTFIASALIIRIFSNLVKNFVSMAGLGEFDRQMGALLGLVKGLLLCLLVSFLMIVATEKTRTVIEASNTGPYFAAFVSSIQSHLPDSEMTQKFAAYVAQYKEKKDGEDDGTVTKSIANEVQDLKKVLISKVLSQTASDIVAEAEEDEDEPVFSFSASSLVQGVVSSANKLKDSVTQATASDKSSSASGAASLPDDDFYSDEVPASVYGSSRGNARNSDASTSTFSSKSQYAPDGGSRSWAQTPAPHETVAPASYDDYGYNSNRGDSLNTGYPNYGSSSTASTAANSSAPGESTQEMGGLATFLSSIGGGYGGYEDNVAETATNYDVSANYGSRNYNSGNYNSGSSAFTPYSSGNANAYTSNGYESGNSGNYYQPSSNSAGSRTYSNSNASHARLNSRTYTVDHRTYY